MHVDLFGLILYYRYAILVPATLFLGPIVILTAGVLVRLGVLDPVNTILLFMCVELAGDIVLYWTGFHYGERFVKRWGTWFGITDGRIADVKQLFIRWHDWIIFISKITAGFGFAPVIYFTAGMSRVPFKRYMILNVVGQILWTSIMLGIGYYLSDSYLKIGNGFQRASYAATVIVVLALIVMAGRWIFWQAMDKTSRT